MLLLLLLPISCCNSCRITAVYSYAPYRLMLRLLLFCCCFPSKKEMKQNHLRTFVTWLLWLHGCLTWSSFVLLVGYVASAGIELKLQSTGTVGWFCLLQLLTCLLSFAAVAINHLDLVRRNEMMLLSVMQFSSVLNADLIFLMICLPEFMCS